MINIKIMNLASTYLIRFNLIQTKMAKSVKICLLTLVFISNIASANESIPAFLRYLQEDDEIVDDQAEFLE